MQLPLMVMNIPQFLVIITENNIEGENLHQALKNRQKRQMYCKKKKNKLFRLQHFQHKHFRKSKGKHHP